MLKQKNKNDEDPLFQTLDGTRLSPRNVLRQFKAVGERIGCSWINLHTMRHTYASRLFKEKIDIKVISSLLGHKDVSTTYDIYVHFIDNVVENSVQVLNQGLPDKLPEKNRKKKDNVTNLKKASTH
ncbi:MAG: tyrosine-type recombinase/integrase [Clostridia bacterium]|nr:tyrosine-type recombinase/integrase [Clostridia bacterium]